MADNEQKALQLIAEAEKKLTSSKGFFGSLFGWVTTTVMHICKLIYYIYSLQNFKQQQQNK